MLASLYLASGCVFKEHLVKWAYDIVVAVHTRVCMCGIVAPGLL